MGKKNKHRRRNRDRPRGGDDGMLDDDMDSVMTTDTMDDAKSINAAASEATARDEFIDALELLTEKRTSVRENALASMLRVLGKHPLADVVLSRAETLREERAFVAEMSAGTRQERLSLCVWAGRTDGSQQGGGGRHAVDAIRIAALESEVAALKGKLNKKAADKDGGEKKDDAGANGAEGDAGAQGDEGDDTLSAMSMTWRFSNNERAELQINASARPGCSSLKQISSRTVSPAAPPVPATPRRQRRALARSI